MANSCPQLMYYLQCCAANLDDMVNVEVTNVRVSVAATRVVPSEVTLRPTRKRANLRRGSRLQA
eukprot:6178601-Pleurochrysis_carterae.AAC.2